MKNNFHYWHSVGLWESLTFRVWICLELSKSQQGFIIFKMTKSTYTKFEKECTKLLRKWTK